jgi:hypothetical protein
MTMVTLAIAKDYAGNDVATAFATTFRFTDNTQLAVSIVVDATGVETVKTLGVHYSVLGRLDPAGGTVTMTAAPATGETLWIRRVTPLQQITDLRTQIAFNPESVEQAFDRIVQMVQEVDGNASGSVSALTVRLDAAATGYTDYPIAASDHSSALAAGAKVARIVLQRAFRIMGVSCDLGTAQASGGIFTMDVNRNGTSILATKLTIDNNETKSGNAATPFVFLASADYIDCAAGDEISWDIDQVNASGTARWLQTNFWGVPL